MVGWRELGLVGAFASMAVFGGVACGDDDGSTGRGLNGTGGMAGSDAGGSGGAGGVATGGTGAGGVGAGGTGAGGVATGGNGTGGGAGGDSQPGGTGGDPVPEPGELVVEKVFCRAGADAVDCDEMDLPISVHVRITGVDEAGAELEVFHGEIEEGDALRELVPPGVYTIVEDCDGLPDGVACRDPDPRDVTVAAGATAEARLLHDVDEAVYDGGGGVCEPVVIEVERRCRSRWSLICAYASVEVSISGDAQGRVRFDRRKTSHVLHVPCGRFDLGASTSRSLHICPAATASDVTNGATVTFQVSDRRCD